MTLEEVLANPDMNPYFPSPYFAFVSSDNPVMPRELIRVCEDQQSFLRRKCEAAASRPLKHGESGSFADWSIVYLEETARSAISLEDALVRYRHRLEPGQFHRNRQRGKRVD